MSGWTPPDGPGEPDGRPLQRYGRQPRQQPYGRPQPPYGQIPPQFAQPGFQQPAYPQAWHAPPQPKSYVGPFLIIGGVVAVVLIAAAAVVVAVVVKREDSSNYTMSVPEVAGGYSRTSRQPEASTLKSITRIATEAFGPGATAVSAAYSVNGSRVLFVGVSGGSKRLTNIDLHVKSLGKNAATHPTDAGGKGSAACTEIGTVGGTTLPVCLWLTGSSMGQLVEIPDVTAGGPPYPTVFKTMSWSQLSDVMRKMRPDVEHPA